MRSRRCGDTVKSHGRQAVNRRRLPARSGSGMDSCHFCSLRHLAHRLAADDPAVSIELMMNLFIVSAQDIARDAVCGSGETAGMQATVDRGAHMTDDVRSHG